MPKTLDVLEALRRVKLSEQAPAKTPPSEKPDEKTTPKEALLNRLRRLYRDESQGRIEETGMILIALDVCDSIDGLNNTTKESLAELNASVRQLGATLDEISAELRYRRKAREVETNTDE